MGRNVRRKVGDRVEAEKQLGDVLLAKKSDEPILIKPARGVTVGQLCDQYLAHIQDESNPDRPTDQMSPPQRLRAIKEAFGDRVATSVQPAEIRKWLIGLDLKASTLNQYRSATRTLKVDDISV